MTESRTPLLPHDPYIAAVITALTAAGLEPDDAWTSDAELDPYRTDDDAGVASMLNAVLIWDEGADGDDDQGLLLFWDHPAGQWQHAEHNPQGGNTEPEFLPHLGLWSHPDAVVATVRALLAGDPPPKDTAPEWPDAGLTRAAVAAWAADEDTTNGGAH